MNWRPALALAFLLCTFFSCDSDPKSEVPNIVWIVTEDNSVHYLNLYEGLPGRLQTIEKLAQQGITYRRAFSQAPVCSVARSTIISGCYAPRIGAHYHRKTELAPMPEGLEMFPFYLRQAGYYTTNNAKEDYNLTKSDDVWDESSRQASFKNRSAGQPFFHVQNFGRTHEGQLHFSSEEMHTNQTNTDPNEMTPFPYHPNTPTAKYTYAKYLDHHQEVDQQIEQFLNQLQEDGLMDETIIFYYGDHGGVLPRSKGYIFESGLHVPMVVYVPDKWKHLTTHESGSQVDEFVRFMDLGPTVLNLAGINIPEAMDGDPFLGRNVNKKSLDQRNTVFGYADRFDEKYDLVRSLRQGDLKYIRHYQPFNPDALYNQYRYRMKLYQEWRDLFYSGDLNDKQSQFFMPKSPEALYDLSQDPHELNNLAQDPNYANQLVELRGLLQEQVKSMPDLSFFHEPYFLEHGLENPVAFGQQNKERITRLVDIADLQLQNFDIAANAIDEALVSEDPLERYWGWIVCSAFGAKGNRFVDQARLAASEDPDLFVRTRAAEFLGLTKTSDARLLLIDCLKAAKTLTEANLIMNSMALLYDLDPTVEFDIPKDILDPSWMEKKNSLVRLRFEYLTGA